MDLVHEFAEDTTFHGIKDFRRIKTRWALRLWTLIVLACAVMMLYEMAMIACQYHTNPTATQVTPWFLENYPYPRILFCPNEWINETKVAELNLSKPVVTYALSLLQDLVLAQEEKDNFTASGYNVSDLDLTLRQFLTSRNYTTYIDFYRLIANEPKMVARCDQCDWTRKHVVASGVCIQLRLLPASSAFLIQSPPAFLYSEPKPDLKASRLVPKYSGMYTTDALYVSYLTQNEFFLHDPVLLNRNSSYVLRIKPTLYQRLNKPEKPCVTPEIYRRTNHSQLMCYARCDEEHKRKCQGCFYLGYHPGKISNGTIPADFNIPLCSSIFHDVVAENCTSSGPLFDGCIRVCNPLCHEWVYETTIIPVSQRKLLSQNKEEDITVAFSYQVRYGETVIKEVSTYTWDTFLSNVGGQLGLWMGASIVSLLQLLHFLAVLLYDQCIRRSQACGELSEKGSTRTGDTAMTDRPIIYFVKNVYSAYSQRTTFTNGSNKDSSSEASSNGVHKRRTSCHC